MNSTHNIFNILKLLSSILMNNQNHLESGLLVVLKEIISSNYEPQWYSQIKQIIIPSIPSSASENETDSMKNAPHDDPNFSNNNVNLQIFLDLFKNMCRVLGDKIKLCSLSLSLSQHSNTSKHSDSIESQCLFSLILKIFKFIINCQLDILLDPIIFSSDHHKLISTIDQFVCKGLFEKEILLEHQTDKSCTTWWMTWFYESPWNDESYMNLHFNESFHSLNHLIDVMEAVTDVLGIYIPKLNKEAESNLISKEDDSREIRKKNHVILGELLVKMVQIVIRSLDEVLIPIIMVHVELMKQNVQAQFSQQNTPKADPIVVALKILTNLFEMPSISQSIIDNAQIKNWKKLYACKLVKSGFIKIVLEKKLQLRQNFVLSSTMKIIFDLFIIAITRTLAGFQSESCHVRNKHGNIIPHNIAFANLPLNISDILSILANDPTRDTIQLKQQLDRASLAVLFVSVTCDDQIMKELSALLIYQTLTRFITKHFSLDFLHGVSMIHFLYLFITFEAESNNVSEFKPHTYSKILSGLQATLTIQENDSTSEISIIEQLFFSYDYVFMPWIWRVFEGNWNLKVFVANLMNRWLFFRFQTHQLEIDIVIQREIHVNTKDCEQAFIKVGKLLFNNTFAVQVLLMIFSSLRMHSDDNEKEEITRLFMIVASIFFCIVIYHNQFNPVQSLEERKDLMTNLSKFWMEMIKLMVTPGIIENIPTGWLPIVNIIVLTLGYHFDSEILSGTTNLSGVLDHTLRILQQNVNKADETNMKTNNHEKKEKLTRLSMISHFLMIFSCVKNKTVIQEIRQHPILLAALRQWTFNKNNINMFETAEVKSSIIGLLSLTIPTDLNNQQQEVFTINELEILLNEFKGEPSLLVGHLCTIISSGLLPITREFKQKTRQMYINIWNMLRDFIVSEIDNHFTWFMLSPVTDAFEIMFKHSDANLGNYLIGNKWNFYMLKTVIRHATFHYQPANRNNEKMCSHIMLQKQFLCGLVRMTEYFVAMNVSWIKFIFTENIIEFFISLAIEKIDFIFLETLLRMLYQLYENSLLSESQRVRIHALIHPTFDKSNILKTSIRDNTKFDHRFLMIRPHPNHQLKLFSLGKVNKIEENLEKRLKNCVKLTNDFVDNNDVEND